MGQNDRIEICFRRGDHHEIRTLAVDALAILAGIVWLAGANPGSAGEIKMARHPDYHEGKIVFSYLGDIWLAQEDGSNPRRLTVHKAFERAPAVFARRQMDRFFFQSLWRQRCLRYSRRRRICSPTDVP